MARRNKLASSKGGRLVVHIVEMSIKCPVAPLEFTFLADAHFRESGMRDRVDITYVTPLDGASTKPVASKHLAGMLRDRGIASNPTSWSTASIGSGQRAQLRTGGQEHPAAKAYDTVFALGDASDIPTSKAGSVAHFLIEMFTDNFLEHDFNYDTEPLPGKYPVPVIGPFTLLEESRANHWGKLGFRWAYWHLLLRGRSVPVPALMSMAGKRAAPQGPKAPGRQ